MHTFLLALPCHITFSALKRQVPTALLVCERRKLEHGLQKEKLLYTYTMLRGRTRDKEYHEAGRGHKIVENTSHAGFKDI